MILFNALIIIRYFFHNIKCPLTLFAMTEKETRDVCSPLSAGQSKQADNLEREIEGQAIEMDEQQIQSHHTTSSQPLESKARTTALVVTLTGAAFLNTLTVQAVVIVLPTIGKALNIPVARQQWIVSAYSLSFGCFLLLWGRLADVYGKRLIFILGSLWVAILSTYLEKRVFKAIMDTISYTCLIPTTFSTPTCSRRRPSRSSNATHSE